MWAIGPVGKVQLTELWILRASLRVASRSFVANMMKTSWLTMCAPAHAHGKGTGTGTGTGTGGEAVSERCSCYDWWQESHALVYAQGTGTGIGRYRYRRVVSEHCGYYDWWQGSHALVYTQCCVTS